MDIKQLNLLYFPPTGTTQKIAKGIATEAFINEHTYSAQKKSPARHETDWLPNQEDLAKAGELAQLIQDKIKYSNAAKYLIVLKNGSHVL